MSDALITIGEYIAGKLRFAPVQARCPGCGALAAPFAIVKSAGRWRCGHCLINAARAIAPAWELTWADVRGERDLRLARTDWTQLPDVPESIREAWRPYRQALRDVTAQSCAPADVTWPQPPA